MRWGNITCLETSIYIECYYFFLVSSEVMNFSSKTCILELFLKIPRKGREVRDAVVVCELCSPMGI